MSFNFEWPEFSPEFYESAKEILAQALNKGETPPIIADRIEVKELNMGTLPPELEILEIGDLSTDRFRGIFRLSYSGDAYIVLQTKVQANPLNVPRPALDILGTPRILFAAAPLVVPMTLRLSNLSLRAIVVLVVSRQKGITLVFKNDPLEAVNVSSSFDGVDSVAGYIQREIEAQLREAFRSDLPSVIHRLSQKWLSGEVKTAERGAAIPGSKRRGMSNGFSKEATIQTRTTVGTGEKMRTRALTTRLGDLNLDVDKAESVEYRSDGGATTFTTLGGRETHSETSRGFEGKRDRTAGTSRSRPKAHARSSSFAPSSTSILDVLDSVPESIENYDPTYGLRPESAPQNTGFANYERVVRTGASGRGLGDVLDEQGEEDSDSFDFEFVGMPDLDGVSDKKWASGGSHLDRHHGYDDEEDDGLEFDDFDPDHPRHRYETIPAVGGGTITRPRVFHTQSQMRTRTYSQGSLTAHGSPSTTAATTRARLGRVSTESIASDPFGSPPDHPSHRAGVLDTLRLYGAGTASIAGASSARFPFPKLSSSTSAAKRKQVHPSLPRSSSAPNVRRNVFEAHRSALSSQLSMSGMATRGPSSVGSGYSSPPSSITSPIMIGEGPDEEEEEALVYPPTRPTPIDLLSCSPSSILHDSYDDDLPITLNPANNEQCGHLTTLNHSNYTLSPFTRNHEHFTARSTPYGNVRVKAEVGHVASLGEDGAKSMIPIGISREPNSGAPIKAKRKRVHRIGAAAAVRPERSISSGISSGAGSTESWARSRVSPPMMGQRGIRSLNGSVSGKRWGGDGMMMPGLGSSVGRMRVGRAPSELSDYFPSMSDLGRRSGAVRR
ncbi:BZ3500_MvSof-1268-A1-R1_Chr10-4g03112 [Microbotryum saponariae]|uniref:Mitochondrial distribution and morphology protein 34 n=1 Tax=Microbotryum saponariae TaxID=289078 RepID=A0A2X0KRN5_9BASI|nr:BZ3501_MvSof-1269-A2-R1_Chr10-2g02687 [Microbotryum saponariae]SDA01166.1 BZ3500_MvSof-1268-A1-R1_Chr10-4g03112 [Microbotryum saponariae]